MNIYTKEQMQTLKKMGAVEHFNTVLDSQYKRGTIKSENELVADIYDAATNTKIQRNFSCKSCVFNLFKLAGELYRKSELYYKQEAMKKAREAKQNKKDKE